MKATVHHSPDSFCIVNFVGRLWILPRLLSETTEAEKGCGCVHRLEAAPEHHCITLKSEADLFVWVGAWTGVSGLALCVCVCVYVLLECSTLSLLLGNLSEEGQVDQVVLIPKGCGSWPLIQSSWTAKAIRVLQWAWQPFSLTNDWWTTF